LTYARADFQTILGNRSETASNEVAYVVDSLYTRNQQAQLRLDQTTNNTCIQNLRNILNNVVSLSGFRIGACSRQFYNQKMSMSDPIYEQIDRFQIRVNNLPIAFMDVLRDEHLLNDEERVVEALEARYLEEVRVHNVDYNDFLNNEFTQMELQLSALINNLNTCFEDIVTTFHIAAEAAETDISFTCGQ
jgi:hypothetical protein